MEKFSPTPEEKEWCIQTVSRIANQIPKQYTGIVKARLKNQGIEVNNRYIIDCKNMLRYDIRVVKVLEDLARDLNRTNKVYDREKIRRNFSKP